MKCRICGEEIDEFETIANVKDDCNRYYMEKTIRGEKEARFFYCNRCMHGQLEYVLDDDYYNEYNSVNGAGFKTIGRSNVVYNMDYYDRVLRVLSSYGRHDRILDIGCGRGDLLKIASKYYDSIEGIEPTKAQADIAKRFGAKVTVGYFDESFNDSGYNSVVMTQVLEHLEQPVDVLRKTYDVLECGGGGYFDVPNGAKIFFQNKYYDVFFEHINYWSVNSLAKALTKVGYSIVSIGEILEENHIGAYVLKRDRSGSFDGKIKKDQEYLDDITKEYCNISIWGAGVKGSIFCRLLGENSKVRYLFDVDKTLEGLYIEGFNVPISQPCADTISENDCIIISALEHKEEIKNTLIHKYDFKGKIICIDEIQM